jgi:hypothetical protein
LPPGESEQPVREGGGTLCTAHGGGDQAVDLGFPAGETMLCRFEVANDDSQQVILKS